MVASVLNNAGGLVWPLFKSMPTGNVIVFIFNCVNVYIYCLWVWERFLFAERLVRVFTSLHFIVEVNNDLTDDELMKCMKVVSERDHQRYDCFVCCILSHGATAAVYGTDGRTVPIKDLTIPFKPTSCPSLSDKPKMFFIQACQGTVKQLGSQCKLFAFTFFT